jgi:glycogen operon protein
MSDEHWAHAYAKTLGVYLNGEGLHWAGPRGEKIIDDSFYILFNAHSDNLQYTLPSDRYGSTWKKVLDTADPRLEKLEGDEFKPGESISVPGNSIIVLACPSENATRRKKGFRRSLQIDELSDSR